MRQFKTLQGVLEASPKALCEVPGIGPINLFGIKLIKAVADRYLEKRLLHKDALNSSKELFEYLSPASGIRPENALMLFFSMQKTE
jgi:DNA repair protein RadC